MARVRCMRRMVLSWHRNGAFNNLDTYLWRVSLSFTITPGPLPAGTRIPFSIHNVLLGSWSGRREACNSRLDSPKPTTVSQGLLDWTVILGHWN